jgi:hypothetical protein
VNDYRQCFAHHRGGRVVLRAFGRSVDPAARRAGTGALFDGEEILAVHEGRGASGRAEPVIGTDCYRRDLGGATPLGERLFEDAKSLCGARTALEVKEFYPQTVRPSRPTNPS